MNITGMVHININCRDYARSKAFYEMLGFVEVWKVPETNSPEVNAAVGMQDYQVNGAIMALQGAEPAMLIDLLEWQQPRDNADPYPNLHRPGLARLEFVAQETAAVFSSGNSPLHRRRRRRTG